MKHRRPPRLWPLAVAATVVGCLGLTAAANSAAPRVHATAADPVPVVAEWYEVTDLVRLPVVASPAESEPVRDVAEKPVSAPSAASQVEKARVPDPAPRTAPRATERAAPRTEAPAAARATAATTTAETTPTTEPAPTTTAAPTTTPTAEPEPVETPTPTTQPTPTTTEPTRERPRWWEREWWEQQRDQREDEDDE